MDVRRLKVSFMKVHSNMSDVILKWFIPINSV